MILVDGQSRLAGPLRDISNTTLIINCNLVDWDQGDRIKEKKWKTAVTHKQARPKSVNKFKQRKRWQVTKNLICCSVE